MSGPMTTRSEKGKELCALLRRELGIPDTARWFEVRFAVNDAVTVRCEYMAQEPADPKAIVTGIDMDTRTRG